MTTIVDGDKMTELRETATLYRDAPARTTPLVTLLTGPVAPGDLLLVGAGGLLRALAGSGAGVAVNRRYKVGGVWGALETLYTFSVPTGVIAHRGFGFGSIVAGAFDDVEITITGGINTGTTTAASLGLDLSITVKPG
jgi:hypothetical protein